MFGARVVAIANSQSAGAADPVLKHGFPVERASDGPRRWWQRLFAAGAGNDQPLVVKGTGVVLAAEPVELRPRPVVRLDPARGIIE